MVEKIITKPEPVKPTDKLNVGFTLAPVDELPRRAYRKGSKYDPILDQFIKSKQKNAKLQIEGKTANYIRTQMKKRLEARKLQNKYIVSVVNDICYLSIVEPLK